MKTLFAALLLFSLVMVLSCQESDHSPDQGLEFKLVVFNELSERTNSLSAGEDFSVCLDLINHTEDTLYF